VAGHRTYHDDLVNMRGSHNRIANLLRLVGRRHLKHEIGVLHRSAPLAYQALYRQRFGR
jgi:hypothetical protein